MTLSTILQQIANPQGADVSGQFQRGAESGQRRTALAQNMAQNKQRFTEESHKNVLLEVSNDVNTALSMGAGEKQTLILKNALAKTNEGSALNISLNDMLSTPGPELQVKLKNAVDRATQQGLLQAPAPATKTSEQIQQGIDIQQQNANTAAGRAAAGDKPKPLDLEKLFTLRDTKEVGSPDRDIVDKAIRAEIAGTGTAKERPYMASLMADGYMPATRLTKPLLDALEAGAAEADRRGKKWTVADVQNAEFQAVKNRKTASTAGTGKVIARKQNIIAGQKLLTDMRETNKELDFSDIKLVGAFEKFKKGQLNDPVLVKLMTQRADALFVLTNAMKMNGVTDKAIEIEEEAFPAHLSPPAFDAWFTTQMTALNRAGEEMNKDFDFNIPMADTGDKKATGKIKFLGFE